MTLTVISAVQLDLERAADAMVDALRTCDATGAKDTVLRCEINRLYGEVLAVAIAARNEGELK